MPQPSEVEVQVVIFREKSSGPCLAELSLKSTTPSNNPQGDEHIELPTTQKIVMKSKHKGPHLVKFSAMTSTGNVASDESYCLVGIYFKNAALRNEAESGQQVAPGRRVGQEQFHCFECNIADDPPSLTVHIDRDSAKGGDEYEFMILVQRLSDGALGIIDPEWENE